MNDPKNPLRAADDSCDGPGRPPATDGFRNLHSGRPRAPGRRWREVDRRRLADAERRARGRWR